MTTEADYVLHENVFKGNVDKVVSLLESKDVTKKDKHGKYYTM